MWLLTASVVKNSYNFKVTQIPKQIKIKGAWGNLDATNIFRDNNEQNISGKR